METLIKLSPFFLVFFILLVSCEMPDSPKEIENANFQSLENFKKTENSTTPEIIKQDSSYNWKMVVKTVDSYKGVEEDKVFINILLGKQLLNGIETTNTTYFKLIEDKNAVDLQLEHSGWTLWEAYGFYPIKWDFSFSENEIFFELDGSANLGLSNCQESLTEDFLSNKFSFKGEIQTNSDRKSPLYKGKYKWEETYKGGICISIEGNMEVIKLYNYPE